ncbi:MAG: tetratricopeptide repeat protein, partial [Gemmatimonadota bacterium]|nr:tetratricopeptide repeat protein [Gemmatimonadota bacterium]
GHAVVSDFGSARAISAATGVARLTETGMSLGTRGYMSPEQFAGLEVDQRSDIYSLGCLAVEMLTGRPPVLGEAGASRVEPAALRAPIAKALAALPADRWNTAGEFAAALRRASASRGRLIAMGALGATVLLVALLTLIRHGPGLAGAAADRRAADSLVRRAGALVSDRTAPHLEEAISSLRRVLQQDSTNARAWAVLARAYAGADRWGYPVAGVQPESLGPMALRFSERAVGIDSSDSQVWVGRGWVDEFLDPARKRVALQSYHRAIALDSANADAWSRLGFLLLEYGRFDEGLTAFRRAFALDPDRNHYLLPAYFLWTRQSDSARTWADSAVTVAPDSYFARFHAGSIAFAADDLDGAEAQFSAAQRLETGAEIGGLCGLAAVAAGRGEWNRAREFLAQAAARSDSIRPPAHNAVQLAAAWTALGKHDEALIWLERFEPVVDLHFQLHLKRDPMLDGLRQEPRFQRLLRPLPR